jgi:diguanylate cyclase (GGDEF)-like protein/PAS domain S-box-containing protein
LARVDRSGIGKLRGMLGGKHAPDGVLAPGDGNLAVHPQLLLHDYERSGQGWFWLSDAQGRIGYISESVAAQLGISPGTLIGQPVHSLFLLERDEDDISERTLPLIFGARKTFSALTIRAAREGQELWWAISGRPQFNDDGEFCGYLGNGVDITASRQNEKATSRLAMVDSLTGLHNRHTMDKRLNTILTAYKAARRSCALMMIDLDRFKQVNDTLGHPAGDDLLKQVGERLCQVIDKGYEIGRLGGDEFQVLVPDTDDRGRLGELAKTIISILSQPFGLGENRAVIGASVGIAIAPFDGVEATELVRNADLALYAAKGGGRGQFRFYSSDLQIEAARRSQIEAELREALERDEISLFYQPIIEPNSNKVVALAAELRRVHPDLGDVLPQIFLPIAEDANLTGPLGDWTIRRACQEAVLWPGNVKVAIKVARAQFADSNFLNLVTQALANSELAPDRLELEFAEAMLVGESQSAKDMFNSLKILGVRIVLDHFGTGFSSLGNLCNTPFDTIKFDETFIRGITEPGSPKAAIVKAIVGLAQSLGMSVTADGIAAGDELALMRSLKVGQIQGNIYADAVSSQDVLEAMNCGDWVIEPEGPSRYRQDRRTVFLKAGVIHEDYRYEVTMRNLSRTGCLIEGLLDVPLGTTFVIDFGAGQLAVGEVSRSAGAMQGIEFELPLVDDGAGGLVTRNRISPNVLASAGMPHGALPQGSYPLDLNAKSGATSLGSPKFAEVQDGAKKALRPG